MGLGNNIKLIREQRGLTQEELSAMTNHKVSQGAISALEKRDSKASQHAPYLAEALGVDISVLLADKPDAPGLTAQQTLPKYGAGNNLPVVGTAQLGDDGYWAELDYPTGHGDGYIQYPSKDPCAYALRCKGDSMKPRIKQGEYVVIEPSQIPVNGDEVLVKCKKGRVMVKELLYIRDNVVHLGSVNEAHGKLSIDLAEIETIHYVAAIVKNALWKPD